MASNYFGDIFRVTTFGESHGPAIGSVIDGVPAGFRIDEDAIRREMQRRRPGSSAIASPRRERDEVEIISGVFQSTTTGAPIAMIIKNEDQRPGDYEELKDLFRPGHADSTSETKYGYRDWRGGGRSSGRETAARVAAGAIAKQILSSVGIRVIAHVTRIENVVAETFDEAEIERNEVRCADPAAAMKMREAILAASAEGDSLGGIVEVISLDVPAGFGDPVFHKLDAKLAEALMSIGAVKGIEIGDGFLLSSRRGSHSNDPIGVEGGSNHMGGILGGISTGAPVVARIAVKPTPSIAKPQRTVGRDGTMRETSVTGRHDACICPRIVPVAEAMAALVLCDAMLKQRSAKIVQSQKTGENSYDNRT